MKLQMFKYTCTFVQMHVFIAKARSYVKGITTCTHQVLKLALRYDPIWWFQFLKPM
jgi:hypothetical protein